MLLEPDLPRHASKLFSGSEPTLLSILCAYSALAPTKRLSLSRTLQFNEAHTFFVNKILLNDHLKNYPPSELYQQSFWKWALDQLEALSRNDEDSEIDERIYAYYLSLGTSVRSGAPPPNSYITHYWYPPGPKIQTASSEDVNPETLTLLESRTTIEAGTTGLRTWRASLILAQYLIQHSELVAYTNVLELGSGTGFIGILVASLQLHAVTSWTTDSHPDYTNMPTVYLTDVNSVVLARCQNNVQLSCNRSSSHPHMEYRSLDWLDSLSFPESLSSLFGEARADVVLGADIVFDPVLVCPLVKTLCLALSSECTRLALIALTVRNEGTLAYFLDEIRKVLKIEEVDSAVTSNLSLQTLEQVDAGLQVKIFRITSAE
ncbi:putative methyltransferase-domain-containing protein [Melanogaster broomeanus]|nr:putative methyltransferase-domain-containing protein [Melanogaster broomeanus]